MDLKFESRNVPPPPAPAAQVCRTYATTGNCPYGFRCRFIHTEYPGPAGGGGGSSAGSSQHAPLGQLGHGARLGGGHGGDGDDSGYGYPRMAGAGAGLGSGLGARYAQDDFMMMTALENLRLQMLSSNSPPPSAIRNRHSMDNPMPMPLSMGLGLGLGMGALSGGLGGGLGLGGGMGLGMGGLSAGLGSPGQEQLFTVPSQEQLCMPGQELVREGGGGGQAVRGAGEALVHHPWHPHPADIPYPQPTPSWTI